MTTRRATTTIACLALLVLPTRSAAAGSLTDRTLVHDGLTRTFREYVPAGLPASGAPLVIALHGGGSDATGDFDETGPTSPLAYWMTIADADKLVVVYPHAIANNWHDCRSDAHDVTGTQDDVGFISSLIDDVSSRHTIDADRVYVTGWSNGGMMSYRVAMELSDRVAAVAPVIANMPVDAAGECSPPPRPVTVAIMNGDAEQVFMPWSGGCVLTCVPRLERGAVLSAEASRDWWIEHNEASSAAAAHDYPNTVLVQDTSTVTRWIHSGASAEVAFFRVLGGGHTMPSIAHHHTLAQRAILGPQNWDIEGATELWAVLKQYTRP